MLYLINTDENLEVVTTLATLGAFGKYSEVFYRVYLPSKRGSNQPRGLSRKSSLVVTNLGPLAVTLADVVDALENMGSSDGVRFLLGLFVPITLSTTLVNSLEELKKLLTDSTDLLKKIVKGLTASVNQAYKKVIERYSSIKCGEVQCARILVPERINIKDYVEFSTSEGNCLPNVVISNVELAYGELCGGSSGTLSGCLGLGLVPLTGTFMVKNRLVLFREGSRDVIEVFNELVSTTYLRILKVLFRESLNVLSTDRGLGNDMSLLVDTTHGLNSATTLMVQVIKDALPLIKYDALCLGFKPTVRFYNSDPVVYRGDCDLLEFTFNNNISYYYTPVDWGSVRYVTKYVEELLYSSYGNNLFMRALQGIYLINHGLIPWGLYMLETMDGAEAESESMEPLIKLDPKEVIRGGHDIKELRVNYRACPSKSDARLAYLKELAGWLIAIAKDYVSKFLSRSRRLHVNCWEGIVESSKIRCYLLKELEKVATATDKHKWDHPEIGFLSELVEDVAKVIFINEVDNLMNNPFSVLKYQVPNVLVGHYEGEHLRHGCSEILREPHNYKDSHYGNIYCLTPMKVQESMRNVIAHAGLTSVHRGIAFLLHDDREKSCESRKCKCLAVCIAGDFPFEKLMNEISKYGRQGSGA